MRMRYLPLQQNSLSKLGTRPYHGVHSVGGYESHGVDGHLRTQDVEEPAELTQSMLPPAIRVLDVPPSVKQGSKSRSKSNNVDRIV